MNKLNLVSARQNHIKVFRKEVYDAIQEENKAATESVSPEQLKGLSDLFKG